MNIVVAPLLAQFECTVYTQDDPTFPHSVSPIHDADLADRVVVMQYGRVVETGGVRDILRSPKEEYTQVLLSSMLEGKTPMTMLTGNAKEQ